MTLKDSTHPLRHRSISRLNHQAIRRNAIPESYEGKINLFLKERGNLFISMIQWHERLQSDPTCKRSLANWLQDLRDDFFRFSALVRIIRASHTLTEDERSGWEACWNSKIRIIQDNLDRLIGLLRMSPSDWSDDGLATFLLMIAVNIGRLHYERLDLNARLSQFTIHLHELSKSLEREDHVPKLEDVWVEMTEVVFCRCEHCMTI
ncbi:hypothetical protein F1880_002999 [Penicillium rolfsii]|nr:hypothetical protein F1880_002999 [Penicillium rolfsii]